MHAVDRTPAQPYRPRRRAALLALTLAALPCLATARPGDGRVAAPGGLPCPRDQLTMYGGTVLAYRRDSGRTEVRIRTDWETTETVVVVHRGSDDARRWFRIDGRPFEGADWPRIEVRPGRLRPGLRVTAWVCDDGRNPLLDWAPPRAP